MFVWDLSTHKRMFQSITGEGLQILTYVRHSWPLSHEGSLMQRRIQRQRRRTGRAPPCLKIFKGVYLKFRLYDTQKLYCNQHAMFTICILFSTLTKKHRVCVKGHQSNLQTSDRVHVFVMGKERKNSPNQ